MLDSNGFNFSAVLWSAQVEVQGENEEGFVQCKQTGERIDSSIRKKYRVFLDLQGKKPKTIDFAPVYCYNSTEKGKKWFQKVKNEKQKIRGGTIKKYEIKISK